jgi:hypothetical protein
MNKEFTADIRNKLQASRVALEALKDGKTVPVNLVDIALKDLDKILEMLDKE